MVLYFTSNVVSPPAQIFMGFDKHENEELIRWGWPEDVWFHVDKLSSAHVYLRLKPGQTLDDIPSQLLDDCAQLVKANSIQGNKMNSLQVVCTMWENLHKTGDMVVGQVGFKNQKAVRLVKVEKRINEIVNRLEKTKKEAENVDLKGQREERDRIEREKSKEKMREQKKLEAEEAKRREEEKQLRSYDSLFNSESAGMVSNKDVDPDDDDFM